MKNAKPWESILNCLLGAACIVYVIPYRNIHNPDSSMEILKLISLVFIPFLLPALLILASSEGRDKEKFPSQLKYMSYLLSLKAQLGLHAQLLFWLTITIPFFGFLTTGFYAWDGYELDISSQGFTTFLNISTLPIAVWGLCLPLAVLVARLHATIQTAEQIAIAQGSASRDQLKLNAEQFDNAKDHFTIQLDKTWATNPGVLTGSFRELIFSSSSLFVGVFHSSNTRTGLVPCNEKSIESLHSTQKTFLKMMKREGKENHAHIVHLLSNLGISTDKDDLTTKDADFFNYLAIFCNAIKSCIEKIEAEHI